MEETSPKPPGRIILLSTPWPLYSRPSMQLGTLKAYLKEHRPAVEIDTYHLYLKVAEQLGYETYHALSQRTWPAECIYGALLYPERLKKIEKVFYREAKGEKGLAPVHFKELVSKVQQITDGLIKGVDWSLYRLTGFSLCLCQLTSTLYFIRRVKALTPNLPVAVGGSLFSGDLAHGFIKAFPDVDFYINGEGERPLARLVGHLKNLRQALMHPPDPAIITKYSVETGKPVSTNQLSTLKTLPCPDYDDYFRLLKNMKPEKKFFPTLPLEMSRGCWWSDTACRSRRAGCAFCNLNLQWEGYRSKAPSQVVSEVDGLTRRHQVLSVAFTDNLLPLKTSARIFPALCALEKDLQLFGEIRATTPRHTLEGMISAGVGEIQIGIEALSTSLLNKLGKGTTAIQNLQIMRDCEELGLRHLSNLILRFPSSSPSDVEETLRALDFAQPFCPLRAVTFWLGFGSPVWRHRHAYGIKAIFNHPHYRALFPRSVSQGVPFMIQSYRGDRVYQKKLWRPVKEKIHAWGNAYEAMQNRPISSPILAFRDGGDFMIIRQRRHGKDPMTHRLVGPSRSIYLFCCKNRSLKRILAFIPKIGEDKILSFLRMMVHKRLMFEENGRYLSLAVSLQKKKSFR